jgi:large subunit ribosomal protein L34
LGRKIKQTIRGGITYPHHNKLVFHKKKEANRGQISDFKFQMSDITFYDRISSMAAKRTYQPKAKKHSRVHGFLKRMASATGRNVLKRRRAMGRKKISA